jgi:hypothetical protein
VLAAADTVVVASMGGRLSTAPVRTGVEVPATAVGVTAVRITCAPGQRFFSSGSNDDS